MRVTHGREYFTSQEEEQNEHNQDVQAHVSTAVDCSRRRRSSCRLWCDANSHTGSGDTHKGASRAGRRRHNSASGGTAHRHQGAGCRSHDCTGRRCRAEIVPGVPRNQCLIMENPNGRISPADDFNRWRPGTTIPASGLQQIALDALWYIDPDAGVDGVWDNALASDKPSTTRTSPR